MALITWLQSTRSALDSLPRGRRQRPVLRRLYLECLEERAVPTVAVNETFITTPNRATRLNLLDQAYLDQPSAGAGALSLVAVGAVSPSGPTLTNNNDGSLTFTSANTGTYTFNYSAAVAPQKVYASNGATNFGDSVAIDGDTAVVGASATNSNQRAAYVFTLSGSTWTQQAELTAADGVAGDNFGGSVALSGDTIVVGAISHKVGSNFAQGAAYVFTASGTTWTQQQELTASDGAAGDDFGNSVAISDTTLVVGAAIHQVGSNAAQGAAYVFVSSNSTWSQQQELTASDGTANDFFGGSVGISGATVVVGAAYHKVGTNVDQGAAYVFTGSGTTWTQQQELTASDGAAGSGFGSSVAISGDTVVVGAMKGNSAYVFTRSGTTWTQQQKLTAADAPSFFGESVAVSGDTLVVGDTEGSSGQGADYVFTRSGTTWTQQQEFVGNPEPAAEFNPDQFGVSVAISGATIVVGADGVPPGTSTALEAANFQNTALSSATVTVVVSNKVNAPSTVGVFDPSTGTWYLNGSNAAGAATAGQFQYGEPGWIALTGDFTGDGQNTLVVVDPSTMTWYLRNSDTAGPPSYTPFQFGVPGWIPLVGQWNGNGVDGIGVFDPTTSTFYLRNEATAGLPDAGTVVYGAPGFVPVVGNFRDNANGQDDIGLVDPSTETWYVPQGNQFTPFTYGAPGWTPVVGDWGGSGQVGIGVYDLTGTFYLRNEVGPGTPDAGQFAYGAGGWTPLAGQWVSPINAAQHLFAAGVGPGAPSLSNAVLQSTVQEALALLRTDGDAPALVQALASANYTLAVLPPGVLGETFVQSNTVEISPEAAGYGWYVDASPNDPAFDAKGTAPAGGPAAGHEDLLTTVLHEMGHLAGQPDVANATTGSTLMDTVLPLGTRRIDALDVVFANGTFV